MSISMIPQTRTVGAARGTEPRTSHDILAREHQQLKADCARMQRGIEVAHRALCAAMTVQFADTNSAREIARRASVAMMALGPWAPGNHMSAGIAEQMIDIAERRIVTDRAADAPAEPLKWQATDPGQSCPDCTNDPAMDRLSDPSRCCSECGGHVVNDRRWIGGSGNVWGRWCTECGARQGEATNA